MIAHTNLRLKFHMTICRKWFNFKDTKYQSWKKISFFPKISNSNYFNKTFKHIQNFIKVIWVVFEIFWKNEIFPSSLTLYHIEIKHMFESNIQNSSWIGMNHSLKSFRVFSNHSLFFHAKLSETTETMCTSLKSGRRYDALMMIRENISVIDRPSICRKY